MTRDKSVRTELQVYVSHNIYDASHIIRDELHQIALTTLQYELVYKILPHFHHKTNTCILIVVLYQCRSYCCFTQVIDLSIAPLIQPVNQSDRANDRAVCITGLSHLTWMKSRATLTY